MSCDLQLTRLGVSETALRQQPQPEGDCFGRKRGNDGQRTSVRRGVCGQ